MACGLPVIASSNTGASEMVRDRETGLILRDPQDDLQLANLIQGILTDEDLGRAMGEAASRHVLSNCKWEDNASKTRELLEDTLRQLSGN